MKQLLNRWLRVVEKRRLQTGTPAALRRALLAQSRLFFHGPRGTTHKWTSYGGIPCKEVAVPSSIDARVLFYIHGGGFVFGSPDTHSAMAAQLAHRIGAKAVLPRYGLAPEMRFPVAPHDVRAAWDGLITSGVDPQNVVLGGDSAGGAMAFGLIANLSAQKGKMPGAMFAFSPLTDLTFSGASLKKNAESDVILPAERATELAELFLNGQSGKSPEVSPLHGSFTGGPPAWITVGDTEILLDDARRLGARLKEDGVEVKLIVENDLPHVWPIFHNILPEGRQTLDALGKWIRQQQSWEA